MFSTTKSERLTLAVDVGSGSVAVALVHHTEAGDGATILWSHREHTRIGKTEQQSTTKVIKTALLNAFLEFDGSGRKSIPEHLSASDITTTQVLITAPWIYSVTKTVTYSQEHSFTITDSLVQELVQAAQSDTKKTVADRPELAELVVLDAKPLCITANGYHVSAWDNTTARTLKIDLVTSLTHESLLEMIEEMHDKTLPTSVLTIESHTTAVHSCLQELHPEIDECCIVSVTTEATEIGIVRSGVLRYVTSIPTGTYTLARALATKGSIINDEAYGYLSKSYTEFTKDKAQRELIEEYEADLATLFTTTGDSLSIPRTIYVHMDSAVHNLFLASIQSAAAASTKLRHEVHYLTSEILGNSDIRDTALQVACLYSTLQRPS